MANSIRRRDVITLAASAATLPLAGLLATQAQQGARVRRVGILIANNADVLGWTEAFKKGLAGLGWTEGRNVRFEERRGVNDADFSRHAMELAHLAPDAIFVNGSAAQAMRRATSDIPIVFSSVTDPVGQGFVSSLAHPGGNITGFAGGEFGLAGKRLDLLKKLAPTLKRVGFLDDPAQPESVRLWAEIETAAPLLSLQASKLPGRDAEETERAIAALAREPNSGLFVVAGPTTGRNPELIAMLALRLQLPAIDTFRNYVEAGLLASYGPDVTEPFRRAASYVDRILRGEKPRDLPVQLPTKFELILNLKTAKAIGLDIPPTLLALADEVIE